jgi:hypothetical protein
MGGHPLAKWATDLCHAAERLGCPPTNSRYYGRWMRDAGFVDVVERHFYWPLNTWPRGKKEKLIGMWAQQNLLDGVEAMSMALLTRGLKWSRAQVEVLLAGVRNDFKNRIQCRESKRDILLRLVVEGRLDFLHLIPQVPKLLE